MTAGLSRKTIWPEVPVAHCGCLFSPLVEEAGCELHSRASRDSPQRCFSYGFATFKFQWWYHSIGNGKNF